MLFLPYNQKREREKDEKDEKDRKNGRHLHPIL